MSIDQRLPETDLRWSLDGDFVLVNGDLVDTNAVRGKAFLQEVADRVISSVGDWKLLPQKGSNVDSFIGEPNINTTHARIENSISFALTKDRFLDQQDFKVTAAPISLTQVAVRIDFDTSLTDVVPDSTIRLNIIYDTEGKGPFLVVN